MAANLLLPIAGGACIGLSAYWGAVLHGRITGVSGELYTSVTTFNPQSISFLSGLAFTGAVIANTSLLSSPSLNSFPSAADALASVHPLRLIVGGALVGSGAGVSNGCTSGHGVCGLARLSKRSIVATASFMATGIIAASLFHSSSLLPPPPSPSSTVLQLLETFGLPVATLSTLPYVLARMAKKYSILETAVSFSRGALFAMGLTLSGMVHPGSTIRFLDVSTPGWVPNLALVFAGALPIAYLGFRKSGQPMLASKLSFPTRKDIDASLTIGACAFGTGWGLIGVCPAPAVTLLGAVPASKSLQLTVGAMVAGIVAGKSRYSILGWLRKLFSK